MSMDDLDRLCPAPPAPWVLAGVTYPAQPLTLARFAAARRFGVAFQAALRADDMVGALEATAPELLGDIAAATGLPRMALEAAALDDLLALAFRLAREVRDFTAGPMTTAILTGLTSLTAAHPGPQTTPTTMTAMPADPGAAGAISSPG